MRNRLLLIAIISISLLAGCGDDNDTNGADKDSSDSASNPLFGNRDKDEAVTAESAASATNTPYIPTVIPTEAPRDYGWRVFVTNVQEAPSDERGWKNVTLDVVFESTTLRPYPLYYAKYVSILDSTGNWREGDLCCTSPGWSSDEAIRVPQGIRFIRSTVEPIRVPEVATIEQFEIKVCGSYECDPEYAVFSTLVNEATSDPTVFSFPFDTLPSIPTLTDSAVQVNIPNISGANITFLPDIFVTTEDWVALHFSITVENLTGNDLKPNDGSLNLNWITTSISEDGTLFGYESYCELNGSTAWSIPPGYTDTLLCNSVVSFKDGFTYARLWIGFTDENGYTFLQTVIEQ